jgi:hypothetical protein
MKEISAWITLIAGIEGLIGAGLGILLNSKIIRQTLKRSF